MVRTQIATILMLLIPLWFARSVSALVLCAPRGEFFGSVVEGGQVVIRSNCQENETTLQPFRILQTGDLAEQVTKSKISTIGENKSETVGGTISQQSGSSFTTISGGNYTKQVGGNRIETVAGDQQIVVASDKEETIQGDATLEVGDSLTIETGDSFVVRSDKRLLLESDSDIVLKTGSSSITLRKNGLISITGRRVDVKARRDLNLKGGKINNN